MNINWTTVFFQIINFLIIVWILKKYLFTPVLSSMDKREALIQKRLHDAEVAKKDAIAEQKRLDTKIIELESDKASIMARAYKEADKEYATMLKTFNAEMAGKRKAFEEQIITEREFLRSSIVELAGKSIITTVEQALSDLATTDIQTAILSGFIVRLNSGKVDKLSDFKRYYESGNRLSVRTSFELSAKNKRDITTAIENILGQKVKGVDFVVDRGIICGIEMMCPPIEISYGMNTYISALAKNLDDGLANLTKTEKKNDD